MHRGAALAAMSYMSCKYGITAFQIYASRHMIHIKDGQIFLSSRLCHYLIGPVKLAPSCNRM